MLNRFFDTPRFGCDGVNAQTNVDRSWMGDVLEIVAIDFPFIAVKQLNTSLARSVFKLDTRIVQLKELSNEYVEAFL